MSSNIHIRGIEKDLMQKLKMTAIQQNTSVNSLVLDILARNMGVSHMRKKTIYHDLDNLAGTWTKQDANHFLKNTAFFENIDEDLWK